MTKQTQTQQIEQQMQQIVDANRDKWAFVQLLDRDQPEWLAQVAASVAGKLPAQVDHDLLAAVVKMAGNRHLAKTAKFQTYNK